MIKKFILNQIKASSPTAKQVVETIWGKDHTLKAEFGKATNLISTANDGFCIDGIRFLSLVQSRSNYLVVAPSGKGKSQVSVFPFILNAKSKHSLIVNDPSGELSATIPFLESVGYKCHILDFGKKTGVYFNPLDGCVNHNLTQMRKVAKTLLTATTKETEDFFSISAEDCLVLFIQLLMESEPMQFRNLANVYRLILEYQASPHLIENLVANKGSEEVFRKFRALAGASENTRKSIVASALTALSFIGEDPTLCDITSRTTIRFEDFRTRPSALFVHVPVGDVRYYAPMVSLFFQEFYRFAFSYLPSDRELDIMMVLDEFDTLTAIQGYSEIISNARKFKIPQQLILQSEALLSKYGDKAKNILNNCNVKCYYGGLGQEAYDLERVLGSFEYKDDKSGGIRQRPLMTASEIREMKDEVLVIPSGEKPLKIPITPAYKQKLLVTKLCTRPKSKPHPVQYNVSYLDLSIYR
ncbi:MAG: type IV secretory system conjugative DNA transfer family protein [Flavobacteriales bacterium]|nr:type IV secretory system conjugative DNA transfer family protein [Flavobacteriales bacterium]